MAMVPLLPPPVPPPPPPQATATMATAATAATLATRTVRMLLLLNSPRIENFPAYERTRACPPESGDGDYIAQAPYAVNLAPAGILDAPSPPATHRSTYLKTDFSEHLKPQGQLVDEAVQSALAGRWGDAAAPNRAI